MGADGGSIPTRSELAKQKQKESASDLALKREFDRDQLFELCFLTKKPLDFHAIVSDYRGRIYNKEAVLESLLEKKKIDGVKGLRDIVCLKPTLENGRWICPIEHKDIMKEHWNTKFAYVPECGHVCSFLVLEDKECPVCHTIFEEFVVLNAENEDFSKQKSRVDRLREKGFAHNLQPLKKRKDKKSTIYTKPY